MQRTTYSKSSGALSPTSKPRNFVAKNAHINKAARHADKRKKQPKHKGNVNEQDHA